MFHLCHLNKLGFKEIHKQNATAFCLNLSVQSYVLEPRKSITAYFFQKCISGSRCQKSNSGGVYRRTLKNKTLLNLYNMGRLILSQL